jgi:hypothetical protein
MRETTVEGTKDLIALGLPSSSIPVGRWTSLNNIRYFGNVFFILRQPLLNTVIWVMCGISAPLTIQAVSNPYQSCITIRQSIYSDVPSIPYNLADDGAQ